MKEATGELNMTLVTVLIIAGLGVVGTVIGLSIRDSLNTTAKCSAAACDSCTSANGSVSCTYQSIADDGTTKEENIKCPCKEIYAP